MQLSISIEGAAVGKPEYRHTFEDFLKTSGSKRIVGNGAAS